MNLKNVSIRGISDCNKDTLYWSTKQQQQQQKPKAKQYSTQFFIHIIFCTLLFCFLHFQFAARFFFYFFCCCYFNIHFGEYILLKLMENMCENFSAVDFLFGLLLFKVNSLILFVLLYYYYFFVLPAWLPTLEQSIRSRAIIFYWNFWWCKSKMHFCWHCWNVPMCCFYFSLFFFYKSFQCRSLLANCSVALRL